MEIKLSKKYTINGQETDVIKLDFENMTGRDFF